MREYFCAYHSMLGAMRKLSDAECGRLFRALLAYSSGEQLDNLQGREELLFDVFAQQIDRDEEKYKAKCATNKSNVAHRQRKATTDNDRKRPITTVNDRYQNKEKEKEESSCACAGFIADDDAEAIMEGHHQVFDAAEKWGFELNGGTMDALTALIAQYGVEKMLAAIKESGEHNAPKLPYLRKVLQGTPKPTQAAEPRMQRLF